jgi:hypothetical protein
VAKVGLEPSTAERPAEVGDPCPLAMTETVMRARTTSTCAPSARFLRTKSAAMGLMKRRPPWALKKLTRNVAPPIRNAASSATNTPDLPLPATCGSARVRSDRPRDRRDGDTGNGCNEPEREQSADDGFQGGDAGEARAVRPDVDVADQHVDYPSRPPGGLIPPRQRLRGGRHSICCDRDMSSGYAHSFVRKIVADVPEP